MRIDVNNVWAWRTHIYCAVHAWTYMRIKAAWKYIFISQSNDYLNTHLTQKALNGTAPEYITNLLILYIPCCPCSPWPPASACCMYGYYPLEVSKYLVCICRSIQWANPFEVHVPSTEVFIKSPHSAYMVEWQVFRDMENTEKLQKLSTKWKAQKIVENSVIETPNKNIWENHCF